MYGIPQGYGTSIYNGDIVIPAAGQVNITSYNANTTNLASGYTPQLGVFVGCEYSTSSGPIYGKNRYQYWAASTNAADAVAYIVDDPTALFRVAVVSQAQGTANTQANTGTTIGYMSPRFVGTNAFLIAGNGGSTATGDSLAGISGGNPTVSSSVAGNIPQTVGTGAGTSPCFRIVQLVPDTAVTVATTITSASSSGTSFVVSSTTGIQPGMQIILAGVSGNTAGAAGLTTYVTGVVTSTNTVTVSASVTWTVNQVVSFVGYPEVIVGWNYDYQAMSSITGI
jgi:hypothetical protein